MQVNASHVSAARGQGDGRNAARALGAGELADFLASIDLPDVDGGLATDLTSHDGLSVRTDVKRSNIVSVELECLLVVVLTLMLDLLASVELLLASGGVHDYSKGGNHESCASISRVAPTWK
jgi:hypothetical protein